MTKKLLFIAALALIAGFIIGTNVRTKESLALVSLQKPMGGTVIASPVELAAEVVCGAPAGPFEIRPLVGAPTGPYFSRTNISPVVGNTVLGLYKAIPDLGTCVSPAGTPVPAYELIEYGKSS